MRQNERDADIGSGNGGADNARPEPRVLIIAENVSERFGGEAILPLQYFRRLRSRGIPAWLITHSRVRNELAETLEELLEYTYFVEERPIHWLLWRAGAWTFWPVPGMWRRGWRG